MYFGSRNTIHSKLITCQLLGIFHFVSFSFVRLFFVIVLIFFLCMFFSQRIKTNLIFYDRTVYMHEYGKRCSASPRRKTENPDAETQVPLYGPKSIIFCIHWQYTSKVKQWRLSDPNPRKTGNEQTTEKHSTEL